MPLVENRYEEIRSRPTPITRASCSRVCVFAPNKVGRLAAYALNRYAPFHTMKPETKYILSNYQHFMKPNEKLAARWLTEEWDGETQQFPSWLRSRIFSSFPAKLMDSPNELAQYILLRILKDHKSEIHFKKT